MWPNCPSSRRRFKSGSEKCHGVSSRKKCCCVSVLKSKARRLGLGGGVYCIEMACPVLALDLFGVWPVTLDSSDLGSLGVLGPL